MSPSVSVIIPSFGRADRLAACLDGVRAQRLQPFEIVVVARETDRPTVELVTELRRRWPELRIAPVLAAGLVAALNCGAARASGDIVAFVDDDAIPRADWLERIARSFRDDPRIAGLGGRDVVHVGDSIDDSQHGRFLARWRPTRPPRVGQLQWFGRMISNHNAGYGAPRDVHVVKGANMAYRRLLLAQVGGFDRRLRGTGSQVHNEATVCLPMLRAGYRVVYDPAIVVDHYPTVRPGGDHRGSIDSGAIRDATHNYALALLDHLSPVRRCCFLAWMICVGTGSTPGLANLIRLSASLQPAPWRRMRAAQDGLRLAVQTWRDVPRLSEVDGTSPRTTA